MGLTGSMPVIILDTSQPHFGHPPCRAVPVKRSRSARGIPIPRPTLQQIHFGHPVAFPQLRETVSEDTVHPIRPIRPILSSQAAKNHGQQRTIRTARTASTGCPRFSPAFAGPASGGALSFSPMRPALHGGQPSVTLPVQRNPLCLSRL